MNNSFWRKLGYSVFGIVAAGVIFIVSVVGYVQLGHARAIGWDKTDASYAIVLGASVKLDGTPSDALYDRVATAVDLYNEGSVKKLLMTGDDGKFHADEVAVMKKTAMDLGVPESAIDTDGQGYRTYESCKRAKSVFNIKDAVIVTQRFHLGRALYLCNAFGVESQGRPADRQSYQRIMYFWARDLVSSFKAWWDINIQEPKPPVDDSDRD